MSKQCFVLLRKTFPSSDPYPVEVFLNRDKAQKMAVELKAKDTPQASFYIETVFLNGEL